MPSRRPSRKRRRTGATASEKQYRAFPPDYGTLCFSAVRNWKDLQGRFCCTPWLPPWGSWHGASPASAVTERAWLPLWGSWHGASPASAVTERAWLPLWGSWHGASPASAVTERAVGRRSNPLRRFATPPPNAAYAAGGGKHRAFSAHLAHIINRNTHSLIKEAILI